MLKGEGFNDVRNVPGSWHAWKEAGYPIDRDATQEKAA
jgi:rhodanese-related sulfurtransferase